MNTKTIKIKKKVSVWQEAGILINTEYKLFNSEELKNFSDFQFAFYKWLFENNRHPGQNDIDCLDGFFEKGTYICIPDCMENLLEIASVCIKTDCEIETAVSQLNRIAVIGKGDNIAEESSFKDAAVALGYKVAAPVCASGKDVIELLKENGKEKQITDIYFSTHGTVYAIDLRKKGSNFYIDKHKMQELHGIVEKNVNAKWEASEAAAYIADFAKLIKEGIISRTVTITIGSCRCGALYEDIPSGIDGYVDAWRTVNRNKSENFAQQLSLAVPGATVIASRLQVNSGMGIQKPIYYKAGIVIDKGK